VRGKGSLPALRATETVALHLLRPDDDRIRALATDASEVSRGGWLWMGLTAVAILFPRTRIAGRDGLVAWAVASTSALGIKRRTRRPRPRLVARLGSPPSTSSMPSSHAAGAIAYATAATWQTPALGAITVPLAALIAWSRAATGRHYPTDIAAGTALGLAAGALVHLTLGRGSPGKRTEPADANEAPEDRRT
jgi:membrane-associated phospholipid phosphatase